MIKPQPFVSIIIPVYNDWERLRVCLHALDQQSYSRNCYEVIVIDNGSEEKDEWIADEFPQVIIKEESNPGSYAARNRGLKVANGEIIGFTDSDCIPLRDWIERGVIKLREHSHIGIVGGRVEFFFRDPDKPNAVELYDSIRYMQQDMAIVKTKFAVTANLFTHRDMFERIGLFDSSLLSGGDRDWGQRVNQAGYKIIYAPDVVVRHPSRCTFSQLFNKSARVVGGTYQMKRLHGYSIYHYKFLKDIILDLSPPIRFAMRLSKNDRVVGTINKIKVLLVFIADKYVRAWTRLKLQFGMTPDR